MVLNVGTIFCSKRREIVRRQPENFWSNGLGFGVTCIQEHDCAECWAYPAKPHRRWHTRALKECARPMRHPAGLCQLLGGLSRPLATAPSARAIIAPRSTGAGCSDGKHRFSGLRFKVEGATLHARARSPLPPVKWSGRTFQTHARKTCLPHPTPPTV